MKINTCYTIDIKSQYIFENGQVMGTKRVDESVMKATRTIYLEALKFCANICLSEWDSLKEPTKISPALNDCKNLIMQNLLSFRIYKGSWINIRQRKEM